MGRGPPAGAGVGAMAQSGDWRTLTVPSVQRIFASTDGRESGILYSPLGSSHRSKRVAPPLFSPGRAGSNGKQLSRHNFKIRECTMNYGKRHALLMVLWSVAVAALALPSLSLAGNCSTGSKKCVVDITVTGTPQSYTVTFDPDELHVKESEHGKEYCIVFKLPPGGSYIFKTAQGDGVVIKDPDQDEFYGNGVSTADNCTASGKKAWRRYFWTYINSVDGRYRYKVQFHDLSNNVYTGDPVITNIDTH
jgi:hypothetical protein